MEFEVDSYGLIQYILFILVNAKWAPNKGSWVITRGWTWIGQVRQRNRDFLLAIAYLYLPETFFLLNEFSSLITHYFFSPLLLSLPWTQFYRIRYKSSYLDVWLSPKSPTSLCCYPLCAIMLFTMGSLSFVLSHPLLLILVGWSCALPLIQCPKWQYQSHLKVCGIHTGKSSGIFPQLPNYKLWNPDSCFQ